MSHETMEMLDELARLREQLLAAQKSYRRQMRACFTAGIETAAIARRLGVSWQTVKERRQREAERDAR